MRMHSKLSGAAVVIAVLAQFAPGVFAAPPNARRTAVVDVVERVRASVVNIHSERTARGPSTEELFAQSPAQNRINGMGTGIIIDPRGYIVTNHHVVEDVNSIRVRLHDGTNHSARVLTRDHESDLAILKIDSDHPLPTMPIGTSSDIMVGETVIAIGNAYGYEHSVTVGVVSAIKRDVNLNKEVSYKSLIQTDASINPGNSGGPLLNINGELIGVNVAIRAGAQGIGFAIPVDSMLRVAADMLSVRKQSRMWHGLVCRDCVGDLENSPLQAREQTGSKVKAITTSLSHGAASLSRWLTVDRTEPTSPAAQAGLKSGDVLIRVGDSNVVCAMDLERAFLDRPAGASVPLVVRRDGAEQKLELVLQSLEKSNSEGTDLAWQKLGLRLSQVNAQAVSKNNPQLRGGMLVIEVSPDGIAGKAGIQRGDILVGLHQWEAVSADNVTFVLTHADLATFNPLRFFIVRGGQIHKGWLQHVE